MEKIKIAVIDDENKTRQLIANMITFLDLPYEIELFSRANNVLTGLRCVQENKPDILLLDIQMPDGNGFDLLDLIDDKNIKVIFITAHEEFAIQAIKSSALDYILKPVDIEELRSAIEKAIELIKNQTDISAQFNSLRENVSSVYPHKVVLKTQESMYLVPLGDIIRCESDKNYTTFYLTDGRKIVTSRTIKEFSKILKEPQFLRCHRSHIINMDNFERYDKANEGWIIMKDNSEVPLSRMNKNAFFKYFE